MELSRRLLLGTAAAATLAAPPLRRARAQAPVLKIGVLTDLSGPYKDLAGVMSTECARMAVAEAAAAGSKVAVEVIQADHQNKADIGAEVARKWFDQDGVDVIIDVANSGVSLAVSGVAKEKNKVLLATGPATSDLTGPKCNANTIHWVYDTWMLAHSTGSALVRAGGDSWYFITADYNFGKALLRDTTAFVTAAGGTVVGGSTYPFPGTTDFSSYLLQAKASGAKVIGLANAGADTVNSIKQAHEFGITQTLAGLLVFLTDVHSLGLETAQGLAVSETFYWNLNNRTQAFSERLAARVPDRRPTMVHAGAYSCVRHYLKALATMEVTQAKADGAMTVSRMKALQTDDDCFGSGRIREDGRKIHPCYLFQVKKPSESKAPWDYYNLLGVVGTEEAFRPLKDGGCPLIKA
jgi:branched-chain amino acid transport system substrate-binding protein